MLLVIEGAELRLEEEWGSKVVGEFATKPKRSCDVAKMTITKDVRSNLAELLGIRRPATVSYIDRECIERVD